MDQGRCLVPAPSLDSAPRRLGKRQGTPEIPQIPSGGNGNGALEVGMWLHRALPGLPATHFGSSGAGSAFPSGKSCLEQGRQGIHLSPAQTSGIISHSCNSLVNFLRTGGQRGLKPCSTSLCPGINKSWSRFPSGQDRESGSWEPSFGMRLLLFHLFVPFPRICSHGEGLEPGRCSVGGIWDRRGGWDEG